MKNAERISPGRWPEGEGCAAELVRTHDWSRTPLGPAAQWSERLKGVVDLVLACHYPMIVLWGPRLIQIYNEAYSEILAAKHPWGMGQPTRDCWPEVWEFNEPIYARVASGETVTFEDLAYSLLRRGYQEKVYLSICYSPLRDETGLVAGVLVTVFDKTQQTNAKLHAEDREGFLARLHDATQSLEDPEKIISTAANLLGDYLQADRSVYCKFEADGDTFAITSVMLRFGVPSLAGHYTLSSFGDGVARMMRMRQRYVSNDTQSEVMGAQQRAMFREAGIGAHITVTLQKAGRLVAAMGVHQLSPREWRADDVDLVQMVADRCWESIERAYAQAQLRTQWHTFDTVLSHTLDFTYTFDLQGRFTYANRALLALWGKTLEEAVGKNFAELDYPPELAKRLQTEIQQVFDTGQALRGETPFAGRDNVERDYEYIFVPVFGDNARIAMVAGSTRDISEHRRSEAAMRASLIERDTLLKEIHHRVKNNLQVIVSLLGLQSDHITDPSALAAFRDTQSRVRAIARIHETLYSSADLAQVEFGHYARVLVDDIVTFYGPPAADRICLKVETEDMVLNIDQAIPLGLILNELVTNAFKHAFPDQGQGRIDVGLRYLHESIGPEQTLDEGVATLCIHDDGLGMPGNVDIATTESMGLYLVRILARQLHGTIELESGGGTRFLLRFPITPNLPVEV